MKYHAPGDSSFDRRRASALASAIVARDRSMRTDESYPTRRACSTLMRVQAFKWRLSPLMETGVFGTN